MTNDPLFAPLPNAEHREVGGIQLDIVSAGAARVKRMIYPTGFRWSVNMKPVAQTELCEHGHVGFLARGRLRFQFADGCTVDFTAPQVVVMEPGHDAWVLGEEPAIMIEFDFEKDTVARMGLPKEHRHG